MNSSNCKIKYTSNTSLTTTVYSTKFIIPKYVKSIKELFNFTIKKMQSS